MIKYIFKRLLMCIPIVIAITFIIFAILSFTPGDPARNKLGNLASKEAVEELREEWGLNDPFLVRYVNYMKGLLHGDMGRSYTKDTVVAEDLKVCSKVTFPMIIIGLFSAALLGIPLGVYAAVKQYSVLDLSVQAAAMLLQAIPQFVMGLLLMLFCALKMGWFPASGDSTPMHFVLPCIAVFGGCLAAIVRLTRSSMLEVIRADYVRTARAKGAKENSIIFKHCLRNALLPVLTSLGTSFAGMIAGTVVVENVFAMNGIGNYLQLGILAKDTPAVMGCIILISVVICIVNMLIDIAYALIDPRIKAQYVKGA